MINIKIDVIITEKTSRSGKFTYDFFGIGIQLLELHYYNI